MLKVDEAIRIAKIIEYAPEDRLPLIVDVLANADINIDSLQLAAGAKEYELISKIEHFLDLAELEFAAFCGDDGLYRVPITEFADLCRREGASPRLMRADLARTGVLQAFTVGGVRQYTTVAYRDGKSVRCVVLRLGVQDAPETEKGGNIEGREF